MHSPNPYDEGLEKNAANYTPLSPLSFIERAAHTFPTVTSVIYQQKRYTWSQTYQRSKQLASALRSLGIQPGDTVSAMLPNVPAMYELHFGVPMTGAVLNTLNIRLNAEVLAFMLDHCQCKVLFVDPEFTAVIKQTLLLMTEPKPIIIDVDDIHFGSARRIGKYEYEAFISKGDKDFTWQLPQDEWDAIALGYTSGTTGNPKGVVTHHRGAYLAAVSNVLAAQMPQNAVYLWTLPLFHCNGWCFPWVLALVGGTNVCLRRIDVTVILEQIRTHHVAYFCGAPIVHAMIADAPPELRAGIEHTVHGLVAGAPPPASVFKRMEEIGFNVIHVYGLTETYGPSLGCVTQPDWAHLSVDERVAKKSRQGVRYALLEDAQVLDPNTLIAVPHDGKTLGEIMVRGNLVMKGYLKNPHATAEAFAGGWFHTGDLAVVEPDGYIRIRDRAKDVIISGGENIASLEIEEALLLHPAVAAVAVIAMQDEKWGEVPAAFVEFRPDIIPPTEAELHQHCEQHLARYKLPKKYVFGPLTRTSTGKVQKFLLREQINVQ